MSVRFKILLGCLSLTLITVLMGGFAQRSQQELGTIATRIYDEAFMAVSYLREAQNGLMKLNASLIRLETASVQPAIGDPAAADLVAAAVPDILGSLDVAHDRAMSPEGAEATATLRAEVDALPREVRAGSFHTVIAQLVDIQRDFDTAVEIFAGDGYRYRESVGVNLDQARNRTWAVVVLSVVVAFFITVLINRSIVPALREAVRIAKAIAAGKLDNAIASRDRGETGQMLHALGIMQASIAAHVARHDALTGLPNRLLLREHLEAALARGTALSVLSLDLDGFKAINETLGQPVGDRLLQATAARLRESVPEAAIVAGLGGDDFAVVQEEPGHGPTTSALAQRLVERLRAPFDVDGRAIVMGASIGIASTRDFPDPAAPGMADALLKNADLALARAKRDGRGTYRFFEAEMDARLQARRQLELDLQTALDHDQFEAVYQPLVDTARGRVGGFEALLRWHHPQRGLVSPAEFIPIAEETGLIRSIGAWVLERACREASTWPVHVKVAVNLSPVQFGSGDLVATVSTALAAAGLAANRLELEITESLLLQDDGAVLETLHALRRIGVRIAMDDFGTGYSSLSYLQRFPFDKIKIDQAFIRQLTAKADSVAIVRAVIGLGKALGMSIIAEGVETAEQLAILQQEGCWDVQGYYFSPPQPAAKAPELIRSLGRKPRAGTRTRSAA